MKRGNEPSDGKGRILQNNEKSGGGRETPAKISEEPSGGNGADYAQDARYRGDGDEASFREKDKRLIAFLPVLFVVFAIQIRGLRIMDSLLMSGVSGLSTLIRAAATGFLLFGEQCVLCGMACKK